MGSERTSWRRTQRRSPPRSPGNRTTRRRSREPGPPPLRSKEKSLRRETGRGGVVCDYPKPLMEQKVKEGHRYMRVIVHV